MKAVLVALSYEIWPLHTVIKSLMTISPLIPLFSIRAMFTHFGSGVSLNLVVSLSSDIHQRGPLLAPASDPFHHVPRDLQLPRVHLLASLLQGLHQDPLEDSPAEAGA